MLEMQLGELNSRKIIARSPIMVNVFKQALKLSQVDTTVLILGESGTGKGVIADLIHKHSPRSNHPMIRISCGAIPETLVETELFGYEKGAFTGADRKGKPGYLELADRGIIFLDEIAELPMSSQVKLLRFLEDGRITRVGGTKSRQLNVRTLCATHRNLESMVKDGTFRQDLFYRLNVVPILVPSLCDRKDCMLPLIQHYLEYFTYKLKRKKVPRISPKAMDAIITYSYPGNVRELMNLCERIVVMSEKGRIDLNDLPANIISMSDELSKGSISVMKGKTFSQMIETIEHRILKDAQLKYGTQEKMAKALGLHQSTIARKLKKYK
jgi:transcriptional regulator with PAS, ATPase and Fis domain